MSANAIVPQLNPTKKFLKFAHQNLLFHGSSTSNVLSTISHFNQIKELHPTLNKFERHYTQL